MDSGNAPQGGDGEAGPSADAFPELDAAEVAALRDYTQDVTEAQTRSVRELFEGPAEVVTGAVRRVGYLEVHKRTPCADGCESCPHGPYVYHVRRETHPDGETHLHWVLMGSEVAAAD